MNILCVIPSRIGSTRLPRKPLLPIRGKPMVQWVFENAKQCPIFSEVIVATDSEEIVSLIEKQGGKAMLTPHDIATGTDRVAFVAKQFQDMDIVINLQGDEPFLPYPVLQQLVEPYLKGESPDMVTLASSLEGEHAYRSPDMVKVITDIHSNAIYFSRAPIPFYRNNQVVPVFHHIGLYAFRWDFLMTYSNLSHTPLEKAEALEQLRVLEHGYKIRVCLTSHSSFEINTKAEYEAAQTYFPPIV